MMFVLFKIPIYSTVMPFAAFKYVIRMIALIIIIHLQFKILNQTEMT